MTENKDRERLIETIRHFRLIDDTYFNNFMDDNYVCMQLMLRVILDDPTLEVQHIQTQREVANIYGRGVRFDVFVRDLNTLDARILPLDGNGMDKTTGL